VALLDIHFHALMAKCLQVPRSHRWSPSRGVDDYLFGAAVRLPRTERSWWAVLGLNQ
jgi:hypothetical protein